jgi:SpoVK/Ycf46/Vps4 family AAA+-type ATPase
MIVKDTIDPTYVLQEKKAIVKKSGILEYVEAEETLDKVGGTAKLKHWLRQRQVSFSSEAREYGLPIPKGLMLTGVPGCGKSMVCKALSNSWNMPLLKLDVGKVMGSLVGSSEENMRKVIKIAESVAPCVLWVK